MRSVHSGKQKLTTEEFISKSKKVHGDKYDYSNCEYSGTKDKVVIICREHGEFEQRACNHFSGSGCIKCSSKKYKLKDFIDKATSIHGEKYDYTLVDYKNSSSKVAIKCKIHGVFKQQASSHLFGHGCLLCSNTERKKIHHGWSYSRWSNAALHSKNFDSFKVYIIKCWNDREEFYKVGKTFLTIEDRFNRFRKMPYKYKIVNLYIGDSKEVSKMEHNLQKLNKNNKYIPNIKFKGMHECFTNLQYE